MFRRPRALAVAAIVAAALPAVAASPAHAASYRKADVEKAIESAFKKVNHGGKADARCGATARNTRWTCRLKRPSVRVSGRFRVTVKARGRWATTAFAFPGFSARHTLSGCCLRRR